jgi:hypothetical protein
MHVDSFFVILSQACARECVCESPGLLKETMEEIFDHHASKQPDLMTKKEFCKAVYAIIMGSQDKRTAIVLESQIADTGKTSLVLWIHEVFPRQTMQAPQKFCLLRLVQQPVRFVRALVVLWSF